MRKIGKALNETASQAGKSFETRSRVPQDREPDIRCASDEKRNSFSLKRVPHSGLISSLEASDCVVSLWAFDLIQRCACIEETRAIAHLTIKTVEQLTAQEDASYEEIRIGAERNGLAACPCWVGPSLRLKYRDQPDGEWLIIAMSPLIDSIGGQLIFAVGRQNGIPKLDWRRGRRSIVWRGSEKFVLLVP